MVVEICGISPVMCLRPVMFLLFVFCSPSLPSSIFASLGRPLFPLTSSSPPTASATMYDLLLFSALSPYHIPTSRRRAPTFCPPISELQLARTIFVLFAVFCFLSRIYQYRTALSLLTCISLSRSQPSLTTVVDYLQAVVVPLAKVTYQISNMCKKNYRKK